MLNGIWSGMALRSGGAAGGCWALATPASKTGRQRYCTQNTQLHWISSLNRGMFFGRYHDLRRKYAVRASQVRLCSESSARRAFHAGSTPPPPAKTIYQPLLQRIECAYGQRWRRGPRGALLAGLSPKSERPRPRGRGTEAVLMPESAPSYAPPGHCLDHAEPKLTDR